MIQIPTEDYVPDGPERAVSVAHAGAEVLSDIAHADRHVGAVAAARKAASPERVRFNLLHAQRHVGGAITQQNSSISNLVQLDPRAGAELDKLRDTTSPERSWQYAPPGPARGRTPAHLAQTVLVALTHSRQHVTACQNAKDAEQLTFEMDHLTSHIQEALDHQLKYLGAIAEFFPAVAAELGALGAKADVGSILRAPADRAYAGLSPLDFRCGGCGEPVTPGQPCDTCGDARGAVEKAREEWRQRIRVEAGSRWEDI